MAKEEKGDWMEYMRNPHAWPIKKYMFDILQDRYGKHEKILTRLVHHLHTKEDIEGWGNLVIDLYEVGFLKAVNEYQEQMEERGFKVSVVPGKAPVDAPPIFTQDGSEKSG